MSTDQQKAICEAVSEAYEAKQKIAIHGNSTKNFYGNQINLSNTLSIHQHRGILDYEPAELFITARAGTPLKEIEAELHKHNQMLPFEPPHYGEKATLGGTIACGFSGPRRPYTGAVRDCILGADIVNGMGEYLQFGGQVMKNVAGYDVSRSMCGALGTLGVIMQVTLRVLPLAQHEITLKISDIHSEQEMIDILQAAFLSELPISASYAENNIVYLRTSSSLEAAQKIFLKHTIEKLEQTKEFWHAIKEHENSFFNGDYNLWRINVPANTPPLNIEGLTSLEWNGGLRWLKTNAPLDDIHNKVKQYHGHATLFITQDECLDRFPPIPDELKQLHLNLKQAFDPEGILNPGRMYSWC